MKKKMYVACLATLIIASCSNETAEFTPQPGEKNARLELTLKGTSTSRATGAILPEHAGESTINTLAVGVFNTDGSVNVIAEPTVVTGAALAAINCTAGEVDVIVVANAPSGLFAGVMTKNDFEKKTVELSLTQDSDVQKSENLPMSAVKRITLTAGANTATIELSRLVARISISSIKTAFDPKGAYSGASFKVTGVFLYNAMSVSPVVATGQPTTLIHGGSDSGGSFTEGVKWLSDEITAEKNTEYTTAHWFYTFANTDSSAPTKFVIVGEFDSEDLGSSVETMYYPIVVNKNQIGTTNNGDGSSTIACNSQYKLKATIKGRGVDDPAKDINPASIALTVSVADWVLKADQEVDFD